MYGLLKVFTLTSGLAMSFGYFPQAYLIFKTKTSKSLSIPTFCMFATGTIMWLIYGLMEKDFIIILTSIFGVIGSWLVLSLAVYFRVKRKL